MKKRFQIQLSGWSIIAIIVLLMIIIGSISAIIANVNRLQLSTTPGPSLTEPKALPAPELAEGLRGTFGIDKNINEATIDEYLNRPDAVYRDMRMLKDPANYEAIDGDSYLSGFVEGFEVVPYPYLINVTGLPTEVGNTYSGKTLFTQDKDGNIKANYVESKQILEDLFPKDKTIFLMCGGGGYAGMTKDLLIKLGWDGNKIYNVGGYWYYEGDHNVAVKTTADGNTTYSFWKIPYHNINFNDLHEISK